VQLSEDQKAVLIAAIERNSGTWLSGTAPYAQTRNIQHTTGNKPVEQYDRLGTHARGGGGIAIQTKREMSITRNSLRPFVLPHVRTYQSGCLCACE
jgi:hypothetical protein